MLVTHILRKAFLEDWGLKLLALVITSALWLNVTGLSTPTIKRLTVPLNLNLPSNAQAVNVAQQDVDIEISGDKTRIGQINRGELVASVDLTDAVPGDRVVPLSPDNVFVQLPQGIKLVDVVPSRIAIKIEAIEQRELEVRAETVGRVAAGYEIYSASVVPAKIRVRGPASVMQMLEYVQTDKINIEGKKDGFTAKQIAVTSPNPMAAVLNTVVDVVFRIGERRIERSFLIPVVDLPGKTVSFVLFAPHTLLSRVKADDIRVEMMLDDNGNEVPNVILPAELQTLAEVKRLKMNQ